MVVLAAQDSAAVLAALDFSSSAVQRQSYLAALLAASDFGGIAWVGCGHSRFRGGVGCVGFEFISRCRRLGIGAFISL